MQESAKKNMLGQVNAVQPKLLKQFFAIELHPAVYLSFIAININVFLLTIIWHAWSEESPKTIYSEPPPIAVAETHKPCLRQQADRSAVSMDDQTASLSMLSKQDHKLASHIVAANTAVALRHSTVSMHHKSKKRKISSKTRERSHAYFVPPPPPIVPYTASEDGAIAMTKANEIASLVSTDEIQRNRGRLDRHKRKASYTIEADDLKQVIVER